jgi:hypothetical protein
MGRPHATPHRPAQRPRRPLNWPRYLLQLERLEDRLAPASSITIFAGAAGTGTLDGFLSATDGTITTADGGSTPGTLSSSALGGVNSTTNISISAQTSITFNVLGGTLGLNTGAGHSASFNAGSGAITFNSTADGLDTAGAALVLTATTSITPGSLATAGGGVTLSADNLNLTKPVNAGTGVVILEPSTPALTINLGAASVPGSTLGLTDAELGEVTASVLRLTTTGAITVSGAVTRHAGFSTLSLQSGTGISQTAALSVAKLDAFAATGGVALTNAGNDVDTLAGLAAGAGSFSYTDANSVTIGAADFDTGVTSNAGPIDIETVVGDLTVSDKVSAGTTVNLVAGSTAGSPDHILTNNATISGPSGLTIKADRMALQGGTISAGTGIPSFTSQKTFGVGNAPSAVTIADINGDGKPDLIVANYNDNSVSVLLNNTPVGSSIATFSGQQVIAVGSRPRGIAAVDLNGDGKPDLVVSDFGVHGVGNTVTVLMNTTPLHSSIVSFTSQTITVGAAPAGIGVGDLNGDGKPDVIVSNSGTNTVSVLMNTTPTGSGTASFTTQTVTVGHAPDGVAVADVNGDGTPDLVVANYSDHDVSVLLNNTPMGSGTAVFAPQQTVQVGNGPSSIAVGDFNNDGLPDFTTANFKDNTVSVLMNTTTAGAGTASFAPLQTFNVGGGPTGVAVADLNGDGLPDIVATNSSSNTTASVLENTTAPGASAASFLPQQLLTTDTQPFAVAAGDLNGDGKPDLAIVNGASADVSVFLNTTPPLTVVTLEPFTSGRTIDLGGTGDPTGTLQLSQAELSTITAGIVRVGSATAGNLTVTAPITQPSGTPGGNPGLWTTLDLETGGGISETTTPHVATISVTNLAVGAAGAVAMNNNNLAHTLAVNVTGAGQAFNFRNVSDLTLGTVDGLIGLTTNSGAITFSVVGNLTVNNNVSTGAASMVFAMADSSKLFSNNAAISDSGGNLIEIESNRMALGASPTSSITAGGGGTVWLDPYPAGNQPVNIGTAGDPLGSLNLTNTELNTVTTTGILQIGNTNNGGKVTVTAAVSLPNVGTLGIGTTDTISNAAAADTLTVGGGAGTLNLNASNAVTLTGNNSVKNLTGAVTNAGQTFTFVNAGDLNVNGVTTNGATVTLTVAKAGGTLNVNQAVAGGSTIGVDLVADNLTIDTTNGSINSGTGVTVLEPFTVSRAMTVGTAPGTSLGLTQPELNRITAGGGVAFGNSAVNDTGNLQVTAVITAPATWSTLGFLTQGTVTQGTGDTLNVTSLYAQGNAGVTLTEKANSVTNLSGATAGHGFSYTNTGNLTVARVPPFANVGIVTSGGAVVLTLSGGSTLTVTNAIDTTGGHPAGADITLSADTMNLNAALNGGTGGLVWLDVVTKGTGIVLGTKPGGVLGLTNTELGLVSAGRLRIGELGANADGITITAAITAPATWSTLELLTNVNVGSTITQTAGSSITVTNLAAAANIGVTLTDPGNTVKNLAGTVTNPTGFNFVNSTSLTIATVDASLVSGTGTGIQTESNPVSVTALGSGSVLTVNAPINTQTFMAGQVGANITLSADAMSLSAPVNGGTGGIVTLQQVDTTSFAVTLGTKPGGTLGLVQADLNEVSAGVLRIGRTDNPGNLTVTANITAPAGTVGGSPGVWSTLDLLSGGSITQSGGATVTVGNLAAQSATGIGNANPLKTAVGTFAASAGTGGLFVTNTSAALTIGSVDGLVGVTATGGAITISTSNDLTISNPVSTATTGAGAGAATLTGGTAAGSTINVNAAITGQTATVLGGSGADTITVTTTGATPLVVDGMAGSDTFNITPSAAATITVHGNDPGPPTLPGDTLNAPSGATVADVFPPVGATLSDTFSPATGFSGQWSFSGDKPVIFDGIEGLSGTADLAVTKTDSAPISGQAVAGSIFSYTVTVTNNGALRVNGVAVVDVFPAQMSGASYTTTVTAGVTDTHPTGLGSIHDSVNLPALGSITYHVTFRLPYNATGTMRNTATATVPHGVLDPNLANNTATDAVTIVPSPLVFSPSLPDGTVGTHYSQGITVTGGTAAYVFTLLGGHLPPGLSLSPDGTITGTPTTAGTYAFTVKVLDSTPAGQGGPLYNLKIYTIKINPRR